MVLENGETGGEYQLGFNFSFDKPRVDKNLVGCEAASCDDLILWYSLHPSIYRSILASYTVLQKAKEIQNYVGIHSDNIMRINS